MPEANALLASATDRMIAKTLITTDRGRIEISTVFLVCDHGWGDGPPILWETMVFGGPDDLECRRYRSRDDAIAGHTEVVAFCRSALDVDGAVILAEETASSAPIR